MAGIGGGNPDGNPDIDEAGASYRFKAGYDPRRYAHPKGKPGRIGKRRMRKMMRDALPSIAAIEVLGGGIDALKDLVVAQLYRALTHDATQTEQELATATKLLNYLWTPLAATPPAPVPKPDPFELIAAITGQGKPDAD